MNATTPAEEIGHPIQPIDILAGLSTASRDLLCTSLALFDDSTLFRRLDQLYSQARNQVADRFEIEALRASTDSVRLSLQRWMESDRPDDELRLILWIYLRESFGLPARLSISHRGTQNLADDLVAAAIYAADPPALIRRGRDLLHDRGWIEERPRKVTLSDLVIPVIEEIVDTAMSAGHGQMGASDRDDLAERVRERLRDLDESDQRKLLESVGADELNDAAIRNILLTGGGLTAFSTSVGTAGFSAYILAAKASAFIPFVSGPGLVSVVSVFSNPITVLAATGGALWWFTNSAATSIRAEVATRVLALLALQGLDARDAEKSAVLLSFSTAPSLIPAGALLTRDAVAGYQAEWEILAPAIGEQTRPPDSKVLEVMGRRPDYAGRRSSRVAELLVPRGEGLRTSSVGALTLGDVAYSAGSIDPQVVEAADFASVESLDDPDAFAVYADRILDFSPGSAAGSIHRLEGYVAERVVAAELVDQGHQVSFPTSATEPGWDIEVDGEKFQVKCHDDVGGIIDHFERYDFPVLANSEIAENLPAEWADRIYFVEGFSQEEVVRLTEESLIEGADVLDPEIPLFAVGVSAAGNLWEFAQGRVSGKQAAEQVLMDGATRAGLAAAGGFVGTGIGLMVMGPAGAVVFGSVVPVLLQSQSRRVQGAMDQLTASEEYGRWEAECYRAIDALAASLASSIEAKVDILRQKYAVLGEGELSNYVRYRMVDDARFLRESNARLAWVAQHEFGGAEARALEMIRWVASSTVHPIRYQNGLLRLKDVLDERPRLPERVFSEARDLGSRARPVLKRIAQNLRSVFRK